MKNYRKPILEQKSWELAIENMARTLIDDDYEDQYANATDKNSDVDSPERQRTND